MTLEGLLQSAVVAEIGLIVSSRNRIALRSLLLREISKSRDADIRALTVEYSPLDPSEIIILTRDKAQELFNARTETQ